MAIAADDALVQPGNGVGSHDGFGGSTRRLRLLVDGDGANHFPAAVVHERMAVLVQRLEGESTTIGLAGVPDQSGESFGINGPACTEFHRAFPTGAAGQLQ